MIEGSCHCARVRWRFDDIPGTATACNCTVCRRHGALWAYGYVGEGVNIDGQTTEYIRGDREIGFHFCNRCGCMTHYLGLETDDHGRRGVAVNLRMAEPDVVADIRIRRFEGLDTFREVADEGRCVADLWY